MIRRLLRPQRGLSKWTAFRSFRQAPTLIGTFARKAQSGMSFSHCPASNGWRTQMQTCKASALWSKDEDRILRDAHLLATAREIAERLGRSLASVQSRASEKGIRFRQNSSRESATVLDPQYSRSAASRWIAMRRATVLHLLDLERAGHSPRFTELNIPHDDGIPWQWSPEPSISYRSPAAMLAEG